MSYLLRRLYMVGKLVLLIAVVAVIGFAAAWVLLPGSQQKASAAVCLDNQQAQTQCTPKDNTDDIDQVIIDSPKDPGSQNTNPDPQPNPTPQVLGTSTDGTFTGK